MPSLCTPSGTAGCCRIDSSLSTPRALLGATQHAPHWTRCQRMTHANMHARQHTSPQHVPCWHAGPEVRVVAPAGAGAEGIPQGAGGSRAHRSALTQLAGGVTNLAGHPPHVAPSLLKVPEPRHRAAPSPPSHPASIYHQPCHPRVQQQRPSRAHSSQLQPSRPSRPVCAAAQNLNEPQSGGLASYGLVYMVLAHLTVRGLAGWARQEEAKSGVILMM